jgi:hypothetical protein
MPHQALEYRLFRLPPPSKKIILPPYMALLGHGQYGSWDSARPMPARRAHKAFNLNTLADHYPHKCKMLARTTTVAAGHAPSRVIGRLFEVPLPRLLITPTTTL